MSLSGDDVEVMERSAGMKQLLAFVEADVEGQKKRKQVSSAILEEPSKPDEGVSSANVDGQAEPSYPKSLFLVHPLLARPLHPLPLNEVSLSSTSSALLAVPIPEGLDLDAWIVPPSKLKRLYPDLDDGAEEDEALNKENSSVIVKRKKVKGKEKAVDQDGTSDAKRKSKKKVEGQDTFFVASGSAIIDTADERAARERVSPGPLDK